MKIAPVSADLLIKLALTAAAVGLAVVVYKKLTGQIDSFTGGLSDTVASIGNATKAAFNSTVDAAGAVADSVVVGVNPNNPDNWVNRAATAGVNYIAGDQKTIGGRIYDYFNPDPATVALTARADYATVDPRRLDQTGLMESNHDAMGNSLGTA